MNLMAIEDISQIKGLISSSHGGDVNQLEAIFSKEKRILLEAPAGCGKTKTMVSKAAYIIATGELGKNKKILALTFSVNAAYRMKKDLSDRLPMMGISGLNTPADMNHFITITNYHGLARRILARYGYLLNPELKNINFFKAYDEKTICEGIFTELNLSPEDVVVLDGFSKSINSADVHGLEKNINSYNEILLRNLIPNKLITYNGYITICMYLLASYPRLLKFYNLLYPFVMIDEFQDTNLLCWRFVQQFVLSKTDLFFMGDPLQRIYGFIGAVPGLCDLACSKYSMGKIVLTQNYRFRDNPSMLNLDSNIRAVAKQLTDYEYYNEYSRSIDIGNATTADINFSRYDNPAQEATSLTKKITSILQESNVRVALLIQSRNQNIDLIMKSLEQNRIDFFYGLFTDDNPTYVAFHNKAQSIFFDTLQSSRSKHVGKNVFSATINKLKDYYSNSNDSLYRTDEDNKIITEADAQNVDGNFKEILYRLAQRQSENIKSDKPSVVFVKKLYSLIESGAVTVTHKELSLGEDPYPRSFIGFEDEHYLYLNKDIAYRHVKVLCNEQGENFSLTSKALLKTLAEDGLIKTSPGSNTVSVRYAGKNSRYMVLDKYKAEQIVNST